MSANLRTGTPTRYTWALIAAIISPSPAFAEVAVRLVTTDQPHIEVTGIPVPLLERLKEQPPDRAEWRRVLALYVESDADRPVSPVLGEYTVSRDCLVFTPRFPLKPGLRYRAVFDPAGLSIKPSPVRRRVETIVSLPALPRAVPTVVGAIYPSSDLLPENQLKFYIHFSAPMNRGDCYQHINLLDAHEKPVEAPFLELAEELWDESGQRLTLLLDPGRVKQDLRPHKDVGRALVDGKEYTLMIDSDWRDARGAPLSSKVRKKFRVTKADGRQPDPQRWNLTAPRAGTRAPLVVNFDEPLDHALVQRAIRVADSQDRVLQGRIAIDRHETRWTFHPAMPWLAGSHRLLIDATLEDLAGNSIERPFEVFTPSARPAKTGRHHVEFEIRKD